jgi:acyl carrier protein phosphodiesterase
VNFLAHLYLAGNDEHLIIGNFIADHVKGNRINGFDENIRLGIKMHRDIDHFTDNHPVVRKSIARLRPIYRKYAGVIVDMYYDHYLASEWASFSDLGLKEFTSMRYAILQNNLWILPERSQRVLRYMKMQDWLLAYAHFDGLQEAFAGMSRRTAFISKMENAVMDLKTDYESYQMEFRQYFPELCRFVNEKYGISYEYIVTTRLRGLP